MDNYSKLSSCEPVPELTTIMNPSPNYTAFPHAPVVEAVLDIQVEPAAGVGLEQIGKFFSLVEERFPDKELRNKAAAAIRLSPQGVKLDNPSVEPVGYLYRSSERTKAVQARIDGFSFNKFAPYENWNAFSNEARELWALYIETATPMRMKRLALRYINRIEIPLPIRDFKDYILTVPEIAPTLPQALAHFLMRLVVPNPEIEATAVIHVVMEQPLETQMLPIIFDIDVFRITNRTCSGEEVWKEFEKLRNFKNEIFFNSITDKTKELFQ